MREEHAQNELFGMTGGSPDYGEKEDDSEEDSRYSLM